MKDIIIPLDRVQLALVSRKLAASQERSKPGSGCRWAAMSAHVQTNDCGRRGGRWSFAKPSILTPMQTGYLDRVVERVRLREGLPAVRKTWGKGYRAMQAEAKSAVMR